MSLKSSYFAIPNLLERFDHFLHPPFREVTVTVRGKPLRVSWTRRAGKQLATLQSPLLVEMQLYFSCVVKKRVLFHTQAPAEELATVMVENNLQVAFRAVQSNSCDPVEFAANFPVHHEFTSQAAEKMHPSTLQVDFRKGDWSGAFSI